jgi:hypothetical protein
VLDDAGVELGVNYPYPVVSMEEAAATLQVAAAEVSIRAEHAAAAGGGTGSVGGPFKPPTEEPAGAGSGRGGPHQLRQQQANASTAAGPTQSTSHACVAAAAAAAARVQVHHAASGISAPEEYGASPTHGASAHGSEVESNAMVVDEAQQSSLSHQPQRIPSHDPAGLATAAARIFQQPKGTVSALAGPGDGALPPSSDSASLGRRHEDMPSSIPRTAPGSDAVLHMNAAPEGSSENGTGTTGDGLTQQQGGGQGSQVGPGSGAAGHKRQRTDG